MAFHIKDKNEKPVADEDSRKLAEDITFGVQQTVACTLIDIVGDPYIGDKVQNRLAKEQAGQDTHTRKAEFIGDGSAFFIFLGVQRFFPSITKGIKQAVKPLLDPIYEKIGTNRLKEWAERHHIDPKSDAFRKKLDEWKDSQAETFAKTSVMSAASVVTNVAAQKAMGNDRKAWIIAAGKLVGATVTMGATLSLRAFAPRTMHKIDKRMNNYIALPLVEKTKGLFGVSGYAVPDDEGHAKKLEGDRQQVASFPAR